MATFTLDTSGKVPHVNAASYRTGAGLAATIWQDLDPFTQGYIEALFASLPRPKAAPTLNDGQIWLLERGERGFSRATLKVPYYGHGSAATNNQCAGLIRRGWLADSMAGIVRITEAGRAALHAARGPRFSDLAPETPARIIADCAAMQAAPFGYGRDAKVGGYCWRLRQVKWDSPETVNGPLPDEAALCARFPPLTPYLGDDGRVYLREPT